MNLMNYILMVLMNYILMVLMNNVLMMFMNYVSVSLFYNWLICYSINFCGFLVLLHDGLSDIFLVNRLLLMPYDSSSTLSKVRLD